MISSLYSLGPDIVFQAGGIDLSGFERDREYRHEFTDVTEGEAKQSFAGRGKDVIVINGVTFPGQHGDADAVDRLDAVAAEGAPLELVRGDGKILGRFVVLSLRDVPEAMIADGLPRKISYTINIRKVREDG